MALLEPKTHDEMPEDPRSLEAAARAAAILASTEQHAVAVEPDRVVQRHSLIVRALHAAARTVGLGNAV